MNFPTVGTSNNVEALLKAEKFFEFTSPDFLVLAHISRALSESPFIKLAKAIESKEETS